MYGLLTRWTIPVRHHRRDTLVEDFRFQTLRGGQENMAEFPKRYLTQVNVSIILFLEVVLAQLYGLAKIYLVLHKFKF